MNFIFLKFFLIVYFLKTIICDSSVIITLGVMVVNHKIQFFLIFLEVYFYRAIFPIILVAFINRNFPLLGALRRVHYAGHISNEISAREGDLKVPKPERPPSRSHPVGHGKSVTSSMCNTVDFLSVCCGIQSGTLCRSGFLGSSIFIVVHCADLLPGFFSIYSETLRRYSYTPTIPGQDARVRFRSRPGFYLFSCRLEVSARGRGYRFGLLRRRGDTT